MKKNKGFRIQFWNRHNKMLERVLSTVFETHEEAARAIFTQGMVRKYPLWEPKVVKA